LENNVAVLALGRSRKVRLVVAAVLGVVMELGTMAGVCLLLGIMHYRSLVIVNGMMNNINTNATQAIDCQ
jgi:hypothetical protein